MSEFALPIRRYGGESAIEDAGGRTLATCRNDATADAIISAVNERDALRAQVEGLRSALLSCEASLNTIAEGGNIPMAEALGACRMARAALASPSEKGAG